MRVCVCTQVPVDVCKYMYVFIYIYTCIHIYPTCIHYMFGVYTTLDVMYREREYTYTKHGVCMSFMNHVQLRTSRCNTYTMFSVCMFYVDIHTLNIVYVCHLSIMCSCKRHDVIHTLNISVPPTAKQPRTQTPSHRHATIHTDTRTQTPARYLLLFIRVFWRVW